MKKQGLEWKVGIFVAIGLAFAAILIMRFSKGAGLFTPTYELRIRANNVGGIIPGASILMAGVPIGNVEQIDLSTDGSSVTMHAKILSKYKIASNAIFSIRQAGFLGDRFIAVSPGPAPNPGESIEILPEKAEVVAQEPFDLAEVAESANTLMSRLSDTVQQLNQAVARLDSTILSDQSLSNLTDTIANFRGVSGRTFLAASNLNSFIETNSPALSGSISNFGSFTEQLNQVTLQLQETVATNRVEFTETVKTLRLAADHANNLLADIEQGKGLAGSLLKNDEMAVYTAQTLSNFMVLSSNINNKGLWGVIRKPKKKDD